MNQASKAAFTRQACGCITLSTTGPNRILAQLNGLLIIPHAHCSTGHSVVSAESAEAMAALQPLLEKAVRLDQLNSVLKTIQSL